MREPTRIEKTAFSFIKWIGSPASILVHSILFAITIALLFLKVFPFDVLILIFNTAVSLEAIYLALFIQMTVNFQAHSLEAVGEDIDEIQEDIGEMQEDVEEIQEDVDELQEDVEDITEDDKADDVRDEAREKTLVDIQRDLHKLAEDIRKLESR